MLLVLCQPDILRKLLLPMGVVGGVGASGGGGGGSGDSLIRLVLGLPLLQPALTAALLELLPEHGSSNGDEDEEGGGGSGAGGNGGTSLADLIVAQMRWLEVGGFRMQVENALIHQAQTSSCQGTAWTCVH